MTDQPTLGRTVPPAYPIALPPADVLLTDGSVAVIRPLGVDDRPGVLALHAEVSDASTRLRFFTGSRRAGIDYVAHLFSGSPDLVLALVATVDDHIVATASAERSGPDAAEVAFLVSDAARGQGLGTLLLEHLASAGHDLGIWRFEAEVLEENFSMMRVFADAGFEIARHRGAGVVSVAMDTAASMRSLASADDRESRSEARSLARLLRPRTVAVVGVRRDGSGTGAAVLASAQRGGFTGELYVVHPSASDIGGVRAFRCLADVPVHVDLAVLAVPVARVVDAMLDVVAAGVSSVVVITSGFAELGPRGAALQRQLQRLARDHSIRLVGPNCLGVMANDQEIRLNATFTSAMPNSGGLAVASQSGGVGIALLDLAQQLGLGVQSFISLGNKADVSGNDLLAAWYDDPAVTAAALYLESFGNAPKFARLAGRFAERKPLLAVAGGRSAGGRRAGASHTAAAASPAVAVDALFAQAGVVACRDAEDLARAALMLTQQPLPRGRRIGIVSNAGGLGVLAADAADACDLVIPEMSAELSAKIRVGVTGTLGVSNPVDLGAGVTPAEFSAAVAPLLGSTEVDALVVLLVATSVAKGRGSLVQSLADLRASAPDKPVLLVTYGQVDVTALAGVGVTKFLSAQSAMESMAHAVRYAEWLGVPHGGEPPTDHGRAYRTFRRAMELVVSAEPQGGWLSPSAMAELLTQYDLAPIGKLQHDPLDAPGAATAAGFPVAVKVADPEIVHKSDRGLVQVGLGSAAEVSEAIGGFITELGTSDVPVLVQPMVEGVEMAMGVVRDAGFGPLVMVAAGGVDIDVWDDRVFLLPPVSPRDAARAIRSLRIWPLLEGHRGRPAADVAELERCLISLGQLASDAPQIAELDLNPVMVGRDRVFVVDAKMRVTAAARLDAGIPRRLRATP
ncbi:MAG: GNAT family N-acetyltransferase [Actinomycetota bacterium]|nr:GNAT family N-acetyltransferase [Actinomycetota bacterium]